MLLYIVEDIIMNIFKLIQKFQISCKLRIQFEKFQTEEQQKHYLKQNVGNNY